MANSRHIEDDALGKLLSGKDPAGMEMLYDQYAGILYGLAYRIVQDDAIAEEVFLESFRKIWNTSVQRQEGISLLAWITGLVRQSALERLRQHGQAREVVRAAAATTFNPGTAALRRQLEQLETEYREITDLMYFQGLTQIEVALKLHLPLAAVKTRARAAGLRLRKLAEGVKG